MLTIAPVIPRIGEQIRLSLILAKSSADLQVLIPLSRAASQAALMDSETSSEIKGFEALNADHPLRQSRYGKVDFGYFLRNQPRCNAPAGKRGVGGDRSPPPLFVKDL